VEKVIAVEPDNGSAMGFAVGAHARLGNVERAKEWSKRALLLDPDNKNMRYNFACAFVQIGEREMALDLLEPVLAQSGIEHLNWTKKDSDLDQIRDHPRYKAMIAAAEARLSAGQVNQV
jgi:adenylate cyclase